MSYRQPARARRLPGLHGLGTEVATDPFDTTPSATVQFTTDPNAYTQPQAVDASPPPMTAVPISPPISMPLPTQMPDGSMAQPMPMMTSANATPKKGFFSFLETTKPDGTVTGPLGFSWMTWAIGAAAVALVVANRNQGGEEEAAPPPPEETAPTPNKHRRR